MPKILKSNYDKFMPKAVAELESLVQKDRARAEKELLQLIKKIKKTSPKNKVSLKTLEKQRAALEKTISETKLMQKKAKALLKALKVFDKEWKLEQKSGKVPKKIKQVVPRKRRTRKEMEAFRSSQDQTDNFRGDKIEQEEEEVV